jgi:hypothetical protein
VGESYLFDAFAELRYNTGKGGRYGKYEEDHHRPVLQLKPVAFGAGAIRSGI